jgi:Protein of unknown function (DUF2917)
MNTTPSRIPMSAVAHWLQLGRSRTSSWQAQPGSCLAAFAGRVWMTETGDDADRFIDAGQTVALRGSGRVVIECDSKEPARLAIVSPRLAWAAPRLAAFFGLRQRWWLAMDEHLLRDVGASDEMMMQSRIARETELRWREHVLSWRGGHNLGRSRCNGQTKAVDGCVVGCPEEEEPWRY